MDFIEQEAECSDFSDNSSSNDEQDDLEGFIDDQEYDDDEEMFANVVKPIDEEDPQPRLYDKNSVDGREIDNFKQDKYRAEEFRKSLLCFPTREHEERNLFFSAVIYGIYYLNNKNSPAPDLTTACSSIRADIFKKSAKIKKDIMLDYTVFGFREKCLALNDVLSTHFGLFWGFTSAETSIGICSEKR